MSLFQTSPVKREREQPLSFGQEWMWLLHEMDPESTAYHLPFAFRLRGRVRLPELQMAVAGVIERHEALRTRFCSNGTGPVQRIEKTCRTHLRFDDLTRAPAERLEQIIDRISEWELRRPFNLSRPEPSRFRLLRVAEDDYLLLVTLHHIVGDAWSIDILSRDLFAFYEAAITGKTATLPPLPVQSADFATSQRLAFAEGTFRSQLNYWRSQLACLEHGFLPSDSDPAWDRHGPAGEIQAVLDAETDRKIRAIARSLKATLFLILLAAWNIVLSRRTGASEVVVGVTVANRTQREIEQVVGCFINVLPVRINLRGDTSLRELVYRLRDAALAAYQNSDVPYSWIAREFSLRDTPGRSECFDTVLNLLPPDSVGRMSNLEIAQWTRKPVHTDLPVVLNIRRLSSGLHLSLVYRSDLFRCETAAEILREYTALIAEIVSAPARGDCFFKLHNTDIASPHDHIAGTGDAPRHVHDLFESLWSI